ncbi:MAG TPA: single-stranded DNA-binding protein [Anaerolineaceae bacterium]|nr:single-stranded DNA-binding protein [Anaerolineaceae bacterium]HPH94316.1 single-stranded DNA-binding protein [Anaerolineaceae bacterium]HPN50030.1 single-stranded DNA-binding protein [Anaerolineaceae bacterium]
MFQKVQIIGHLGRDPEARFTGSGQQVCNFSVATTRTYPGADGAQKKETTWFKVVAWGKLAEICNQYLHKGSKVLVEGRLVVDPTTGGPKIFKRQDGSAGASFELTALEVKFLDSKGDRNDADDGAPAEQNGHAPAVTDDEDIPF